MKKVVAMLVLVGVSLFSVGAFDINGNVTKNPVAACVPGATC